MSLKIRAKTQASIVIALLGTASLGWENVNAENASNKDPELACVDSSIRVGERIVWSLLRDSSKSPQELICEKTLASRQVYLDDDRRYVLDVSGDDEYRIKNQESSRRMRLETSENPRNQAIEQLLIERYETKTSKSQSDNKRDNGLKTLRGFKTLEPSVQ